jgi:predicted nucleic acid-binding protein
VIVVDTNLVAYLVLGGPHVADAESVLERDPEWCAPPLWRSEFRNVLAHKLHAGTIGLDDAQDALRTAAALIAEREPAANDDTVLRLSKLSGCTAYDCEFVATALALEVPLVTSDRQILRAFPELAASPRAFAA